MTITGVKPFNPDEEMVIAINTFLLNLGAFNRECLDVELNNLPLWKRIFTVVKLTT